MGTDCTTTGYAGLGTAVRKLGLATQGALEIDFVVNPSLSDSRIQLQHYRHILGTQSRVILTMKVCIDWPYQA